jgi:hypothetical protein
MSNLISVRLEMVLVSVQDRCTVCAKQTIGSGIVLDHPMVLLGDEAQVEAHLVYLEIVLILTRVCAERTIGSEIVLDTLEGTHR